jgi:hypothetical protein
MIIVKKESLGPIYASRSNFPHTIGLAATCDNAIDQVPDAQRLQDQNTHVLSNFQKCTSERRSVNRKERVRRQYGLQFVHPLLALWNF